MFISGVTNCTLYAGTFYVVPHDDQCKKKIPNNSNIHKGDECINIIFINWLFIFLIFVHPTFNILSKWFHIYKELHQTRYFTLKSDVSSTDAHGRDSSFSTELPLQDRSRLFHGVWIYFSE